MSRRGAERAATVRVRKADLALTLVVAAAFQAEIWLGDPALRRPSVVLGALAMSLPLALQRRAPLVAVTLVAAAYTILLRITPFPVNEYFMIVIIILIAGYAAGHHPHRLRAVVGGLIVLVASCLEVAIDDPGAVADYVFIVLIVGADWTAGLGMEQRERRVSRLSQEADVLREERDSAAERAAGEERARIARELHDIISHHVSVMVLQAGAAREVIDVDPGKAKDSLGANQLTGRQALVELRRLLDALGAEHDPMPTSPQPGVEQLPALVDTLRRTGLAVGRHEGTGLPARRQVRGRTGSVGRLRGACLVAADRSDVMITVITADDQALVRGGLKMILEAQPDIEVVAEAADGVEVIELGDAAQPDDHGQADRGLRSAITRC